MGFKYDIGDHVKIIHNQYSGKIIDRVLDGYTKTYHIKFDKELIPRSMWYTENHLTPVKRKKDTENCPICGEKWKVTEFNMHVWEDCLKCNQTKEYILDNYVEIPEIPDPDPYKIDWDDAF